MRTSLKPYYQVIMAAKMNSGDGPVIKGAYFTVVVEDVVAGVLVVCLKHGSKEFRGVLMDATNRDLGLGEGFRHITMANENHLEKKPSTEQPITIVDPNIDQDQLVKAEESALSSRQSYVLDCPNSSNNKLLASPQKDLSKSLRDKNIRAMRLRPRQIMCSNCKQGIHNAGAPPAPNPSQTKVAEAPPVNEIAKPRSATVQTGLRISLRKRKEGAEISYVAKKSKKNEHFTITNTTITKSPVIKISFGSDKHGKGTVMKIPSRSQCSTNGVRRNISEALNYQEPKSQATTEYRKHRKALKKAKRKSREDVQKKKAASPIRKSKRGHHKLKRKRKSRGEKAESYYSLALPSRSPHNDFETGSVSPHPDIPPGACVGASPDMCSENYVSAASDSGTGCHADGKAKILVLSKGCVSSNSPSSWDESCSASNVCSSKASEKSATSSSLCSSDREIELEIDENHCPKRSSEKKEKVRPLMMRIQKRTVPKCVVKNGNVLNAGDVVWGKIRGFPWWPGKVRSITVSQRDNGVVITQNAHVEWFGSSTNSCMPCSELFPYLRDFNVRYDKKRKGPYKTAIKQATLAAKKSITGSEYSPDNLAEMQCSVLEA